jgi:hypothetical protein
MHSASSTQITRCRRLLVCLLLVAHFLMAWTTSPHVGVTADEPIHIVSGLYYWQTGDYRFQPENGNLPQRLVALPWLAAGIEPPARAGDPSWERADIWDLGHRLFSEAGQRRDLLLALSRGLTALLGVALLLLIHRWASALWGPNGALLALALAAFCPNLLAHAGLATSDTAGALGFLAATLAAWRLCHAVTPGRVLAGGVAAGFLALSKFSVVLLPLVVAGLILVRLCRRAALPCALPVFGLRRLRGFLPRLAALTSAQLAAALVAALCVWAGYGFRYAAAPDGGGFAKDWDTVLITTPHQVGLPQIGEPVEAVAVSIRAGPVQHLVRAARDHRLLPEAWLYGLSFVAYHSHSRLAYFNGHYATTGDWRYFPAAWAWKTPLGGIALLAFALAALARSTRLRRHLYRLAPAILLCLVYGGFSLAGSLNIGLRHIAPLIAVSWVIAGAAALAVLDSPSRPRALAAAVLVALLASHIAASWSARPAYLAFFNRLAGTPAERNRLLVDSNLDWGQGLPALSEWLGEHRADRPLHLSYFGSDDPRAYPALLDAVRWGDVYFERHPRRMPAALSPGLYAFGATQFRRAYTEVRGPWTPARDSLYRFLHESFTTKASGAPLKSRSGRILNDQEALLAATEYEALLLAKLTIGLEHDHPVAVLAGGALLVFELDQTRLDQLLRSD